MVANLMPLPVSASVRRLGAQDLGAMRQLNSLFAKAFCDAHSYAGAPPDDDWLLQCLSRDTIIVLVAEFEDQVVGGLVAYCFDKLEQRRREIYIYDLAVAAERRRLGVASALIGRLKSFAAAHQCWVIFVQADPGDEPAIALYQKLGVGVTEHVLHFDIAPSALPA